MRTLVYKDVAARALEQEMALIPATIPSRLLGLSQVAENSN